MREGGIKLPAGAAGRRAPILKRLCAPTRLADFTPPAKPKLKENLSIAIEAAKKRGEAMDHVLLYGPPGLGKTTLATIIAGELGVDFEQTSGPIIQKKLDLTGVLTNIRQRQVFFIDEVHRLLPDVEEILYAALEDFRMDILIGTGPGARTHSIAHSALHQGHRRHYPARPGERSTAGALRPGAAAQSLRGGRADRHRGALGEAAGRDAGSGWGPAEIAQPQPGHAAHRQSSLLRARSRLCAGTRAEGHIDLRAATSALDRLEVDRFGLDEIDQKIMLTLLEKYGGAASPVGVNTDRCFDRRGGRYRRGSL